MNPILPLQYFIPDVEARTWSDGRLYCYGSQDIGGNFGYCSHTYRVFSTNDMLHWLDHGESFSTLGPNAQTPWSTHELYAPDCVCKDGTYYLYFCQKDKGEGVAVSSRPEGPFRDASTIPGVHMDAIDPAAFVDDDGQAYLYWGQFHCRGARLMPDMRHIDESTLDTCLIDEENHGFHEGACMRKRGDTYYLIYCDISRGQATCLSYATSDSPLGPFTKGGVIIDNDGADPKNWNNHGSIMEFAGQWYVFYHRSSQESRYNRRVCVEPIFFDAEGHIAEVEMTTQGAEGPISADTEFEATRACLLTGKLRSELVGVRAPNGPTHEYLARIAPGDGAVYRFLRFTPALTHFRAKVATATHGGVIEVRLDNADGPIVGRCDVPHTGGWQEWRDVSCPIKPVDGVHALHLRFVQRDGDLSNLQVCSLASFAFA
jgi:hypothetical protein